MDTLIYRGNINCFTDPNYPAANSGDVYKVTGAGHIGGASGPDVEVGDTIICYVDASAAGTHAVVGANWAIAQTNMDTSLYAPLASPTFTGIPSAPTPTAGTNTTQIATTAFVKSEFGNVDALIYKGVLACVGSPNYPAADAGHVYKVSSAGKIGGASGQVVEIGDLLICAVDGSTSDTHAAVGANWDIIQVNIDITAPTRLVVAIKAGEYLRKGQAVYISGTSAGIPVAWKADNTTTGKSRIIGCVLADMNPGDATIDGYAVRGGTITGIDCRTTGTVAGYVNPLQQTWANGDLLFALGGANAGGLTNVRPTSGRSVKVCYAVNGNDPACTFLMHPMENPVWTTGASGEDVVLRLGDSSGTNKVSIRDYANAEVGYINSDGNLNVIGQISSDVVTGTAPLDVASTTVITNLNADLLDGSHSTTFLPTIGATAPGAPASGQLWWDTS